MPGEQAIAGGEAGDAEDLDGLIGDQRRTIGSVEEIRDRAFAALK